MRSNQKAGRRLGLRNGQVNALRSFPLLYCYVSNIITPAWFAGPGLCFAKPLSGPANPLVPRRRLLGARPVLKPPLAGKHLLPALGPGVFCRAHIFLVDGRITGYGQAQGFPDPLPVPVDIQV